MKFCGLRGKGIKLEDTKKMLYKLQVIQFIAVSPCDNVVNKL